MFSASQQNIFLLFIASQTINVEGVVDFEILKE
jgi:hypothetical protein